MARPLLEVADIFRQYGTAFRRSAGATLTREQRRAMQAIENCRTAALGGHREQCDACGHQVIAYNSCRNRHCPKCQALAKAQWLAEREADLLPVEYFHVVFTLPDTLNPLAWQNQKVVYDLLFRTAAETLRTIAANPKHLGAEIGFLAVLHTWGQTLSYHPHLHCVVPGGGLVPDGTQWRACRPGYFLPVQVLSAHFRQLFLAALRRAFQRQQLNFQGALAPLAAAPAFTALLTQAGQKAWVVYAKPPFGGPRQVLDYLGRYTHRVAISNHRLLKCEKGAVTFQWKDYRHGNQARTMTLPAEEFIRRFLLHVLPRGFQRIRQYGWLSNRERRKKLARCRQLLGTAALPSETTLLRVDYRVRYEALTGASLLQCPVCRVGRMQRGEPVAPRRRAPLAALASPLAQLDSS